MKTVPLRGVRSFEIDRVRTRTGSGMVLTWGPHVFVLANKDGTPERSLGDAGYQQVLNAIVMRIEEMPSVSPKEGTA